jgi:phosphocarrier protein
VDDGPAQGAPRRVLAIRNRRGLHARAAAKFVKCAQAFEAKIAVAKDGTTVSGLSIMGLMMLAAAIGSEIEVSAEGKDAEAALEALARLVEGRFDEQD